MNESFGNAVAWIRTRAFASKFATTARKLQKTVDRYVNLLHHRVMAALTQKQIAFLNDLEERLAYQFACWYGWSPVGGKMVGHMSRKEMDCLNEKLQLVAARLGIEVVEAFDEDGWDGETNSEFVTLETII